MAPRRPTSELVAAAWLAARAAGVTPGMVATTLPNVENWRATGFVQVQALPGGFPDVDTPERHRALIQVDTWAAPATVASTAPRWGLANDLAEAVRDATKAAPAGLTINLGASFVGARLLAAYLSSEPRRVLDDPSGFARYQLDVALDWVVNP